jgi:hypothetical protein
MAEPLSPPVPLYPAILASLPLKNHPPWAKRRKKKRKILDFYKNVDKNIENRK